MTTDTATDDLEATSADEDTAADEPTEAVAPGFQRKEWADLSEGYRRRLAAKGYTRADHEAGKPVPRDRAPKRKKAPTAAASSASSAPRSSGRKSLADPVAKVAASLGMALFMLDPFDGTILLGKADELGAEVDKLAASNPRIQRTLERAFAGGEMFGTLALVAGIVAPIAINHGLLPRGTPLDMTIPAEARRHLRPPKAERAAEQDAPANPQPSTEPNPQPAAEGSVDEAPADLPTFEVGSSLPTARGVPARPTPILSGARP